MRQAIRTLVALWFLAAGALIIGSDDAAAAALIRSQAPCDAGNGTGSCFVFGSGIVGVGTSNFQNFSFAAPSRGNASVTFHGSVVCGASTAAGNKVVDLVTQITNSVSTPSPGGPGGMRQAMVLQPNTSQTFNLTSTRVFTFNAKGTQTFRFRVRPLRIDAGVTCYTYNLAFSVVFIP